MKKNILIIILLVIILGLGGYLVYDKVIDKDVETEVKEETKVEEKDFDLVEAKKLVDKYMFVFSFVGGETLGTISMDDANKILIAFNNVEENKKTKANCKELYENNSNAQNYNDGGEDFEIKYETGESFLCGINSIVVNYSNLNEVYKKLFGEDLNKKATFPLDFRCGNSFDYIKEKDLFVSETAYKGCGINFLINSNIELLYGIKSAKLLSDILVIDIGYKDTEYDPDAQVDNNFVYLDGEKITFEASEVQSIIDKYLNLFDTYRFTFKKSETGYYLESINKIN